MPRFVLVLLFLSITFSGCSTFLDWGKRINLTVGGGFAADIEPSVSGINRISDTISIRDGFGNLYTTSWEFNTDKPDNNHMAASLSIPIYWKDFKNGGVNIETGFMAKLYLPHGGLGGYVEGSVGPISVNGSVGITYETGEFYSIATKPAGPAWDGDPGIYLSGKFNDPSLFKANVSVNADSRPGIFASAALKWHFIKWMYIEGGYVYYGKTETKITGITVDTRYTAQKTYDMDGFISLPEQQVIYLGLGFGY
jgi:hypothetical protein